MRAKGSRLALLALGVAALPTVGRAQAVGSEFQVNTYTTLNQNRPSVATAANGSFVVVWHSPADGGTDSAGGPYGAYGVFAQRFDASGSPLGSEFQVNTYTTGFQGQPSVASRPNGDFVVVWTSYGDGGTGSYDYYGRPIGGYGVVGRRFSSTGGPLGGEFQVNTYTTGYQGNFPRVTRNEAGNFVVVWTSGYYGDLATQDGSDAGVFGRRFAANGTPQGSEFQVSVYTTYGQHGPSVASRPNGEFVAAWDSQGQDGSDYGVFARRFGSDGAPLGGDFQVNSYTTGSQALPSLASRSNGDFVVAWQSLGAGPSGQDGGFSGIFAQRFDRSGSPAGTEFQVNSYTTGNQFRPQVASRSNGDFVVVWRSGPPPPPGQDGSGAGVFGQQFGASGTPQGTEFQINTFTTANQVFPSVALRPNGDFVVVWGSGGGQDGSYGGIFGQRFGKGKGKK